MNKKAVILIIIAFVIVITGVVMLLRESSPAVKTEKQTTMNKNGVEITVLKEGSGATAKSGKEVSVHYTGTLQDGTKFDSSLDRGEPFSFKLGAGVVIRGWDIGVEGMKVGEKRRLIIPPDLGYGASGAGTIPPNATLTFEVELLDVK